MMSQANYLARESQNNPARREQFIDDYAAFILSCAAKAVGRSVSKSDDEWSIALSAFNEAIDCYDFVKGSFLSHARLIITRRLIDYRRASKRNREIPVPPESFLRDGAGAVDYAVVYVEDDQSDQTLREELLFANQVLKEYGFSFFDLAGHTPKKSQPRDECSDAVNCLIDEAPLLKWMREKRRLPLNRLADACGARKKTLSFFRFFVITGAEILTRDFPSLKRYFSFIRREAKR